MNRPPPPVFDYSSVHGRGQATHQNQREGSPAPARRPGKEPMFPNTDENPEEVTDGEGQGDYTPPPPTIPRAGDVELAPRRGRVEGRQQANVHGGEQFMRYKQEFPSFDYDHPKLWIIRCERFFMLARIPRDEIMNILCINLIGKVGIWFESYLNGLRVGFQWAAFAGVVCKRFCENNVDVMDEFSNFKQTGNVVEFADKYEEYRGLLLQIYPYLTEQYFLDCYIVRLKQQIRCFVRTSRPRTLEDAIWMSKQFEKGLKVNDPQKPTYTTQNSTYTTQKPNQFTRTYSSKASEPNRTQNFHNSPKSNASNSINTTAQSPEITRFKNQLREHKKCFKCFDSWQPGHKCKGPTFNIIEETESQNEVEGMREEADGEEGGAEEVEISLCAVVGGEGMNTIKLMGSINKQPLIILVDSGSTHSFLDPKLLNHINRTPEKSKALSVTVANGEELLCDSMCSKLKWKVQTEEFEKDFRLLRLGGCDMVLGMDWIDQYAPIQLHTRPPGLSFHKEGKKVLLKGLTKKVLMQAATKRDLKKWKKGGVKGYLVQCSSVNTTGNDREEGEFLQINSNPQMQELTAIIREYQELFEEPKSLPPQRVFDHEIPLIPGAKPVNGKPYRYSFDQKNVIEKMVEEMLTAGIITHSTSPFASPVLLVPKKDNTWRFCVDYRALNEITVKNKFPIPLIEDLFSELSEARYFTKLDLRAGYHQVRMKQGEEHKTAFRTHQGLYEFRVMPFGLTNAPATFQALMNHIFQPLLRKTILVFFDDILIYSPTLESHWEHLREVLRVMKEHELLAKLSKCSFAKTEVEYLGHIISDKGLQTDPSKLSAIAAWPKPNSIKGLRGFLVLTGCYRRFIRNYGIISRPLTNMLKKNGFYWTEESTEAFEMLKNALCTAPVLTLPDFNKHFVIEADACHKGMGAVLMQDGKPIAYFSKGFGERHLGLSIYEKEYLSIINAVEKWRSYLIGRHFLIRTDHHSLKFLLEQKITTAIQQKGLTKLLGLSYTIQYKKGIDNCVADALSRKEMENEVSMNAITIMRPSWMEEVLKSYEQDDWATKILTEVMIDPVGIFDV